MARPKHTLTEAEYFALEQASEIKHEYVGGEIIAMSGASLTHNTIVANLMTTLGGQLGDSPCLVVASDMRLKIESARVSYRYPDVTVICDTPQIVGENPGTLLNPTVLIEVLSDSTAMTDRTDKLREYRQLPSLQAYLLITQDTPRIERYLRGDDPHWLYMDMVGMAGEITIPPLNCTLKLADVYKKVTFGE